MIFPIGTCELLATVDNEEEDSRFLPSEEGLSEKTIHQSMEKHVSEPSKKLYKVFRADLVRTFRIRAGLVEGLGRCRHWRRGSIAGGSRQPVVGAELAMPQPPGHILQPLPVLQTARAFVEH